MALGSTKTVLASAARTATGTSSGLGLATEPSSKVAIGLDVTAVSGTSPTLDIAVEWSHDGSTWLAAQSADTFTQATAATAAVKVFDVKGQHLRVAYTIGGTAPSFTFSVTAVSV